MGERQLALLLLRLAQPGEQHGKQRGIELGNLADIDRLHALGEMAAAFMHHCRYVGERYGPAEQDATAFAADHFFGAALSRLRFFACRPLMRPSTPPSRTM